MLWVLLAITLLGLLLLTLGLVGRVVGDSPHCRACRFDLAGLDLSWREDPFTEASGNVLCPECGTELTIQDAIRTGLRVKRPRPLWAGVAIVALVAAPLIAGLALSPAISPANLPTWFLELGLGVKGSHRADFLCELHDRFNAKRYTQTEWDAVCARAINWLDPNTPEGTLVAGELLFAVTSGSQPAAFGQQLIPIVANFDLEVPSRIRPGDSIRYSVVDSSKFDREILRQTRAEGQVYFLDRRLMVQLIDADTGMVLQERSYPQWGWAGSSGLPSGSSGGQISLPPDLKPGDTIRFEVTLESGIGPDFNTASAKLQQTLAAEAEVVEAGTPLVELVQTPGLSEELRDGLSLQLQQFVDRAAQRSPLPMVIRLNELEASLFSQVWIELDDKVIPIAQVQKEAFVSRPNWGGWSLHVGEQNMQDRPQSDWPTRANFWLIPDPENAEFQPGFERIAGVPLVFREVRLLPSGEFLRERRDDRPDLVAASVPTAAELERFEKLRVEYEKRQSP